MFRHDYLVHHGVKGMKWGVRRTLEQLGHKRRSTKKEVESHGEWDHPSIKKGTNFYRVTLDKDADKIEKGHAYVSYKKEDRAAYKGLYNDEIRLRGLENPIAFDDPNFIKKHNKLLEERKARKTIEKQYVAEKDLHIASYDRTLDSCKKCLNKMSERDKDLAIVKHIDRDKRFSMQDLYAKDLDVLNYYAQTKDKSKTISKFVTAKNEYDRKFYSNLLEEFDYYKNTLYKDPQFVIKNLGGFDKLRNAMQEDLKKQGFDGMVDVDGVGDKTANKRDGNDPLILFDPEEKTKLLGYTIVTLEIRNQAAKDFTKEDKERLARIGKEKIKQIEKKSFKEFNK